MTNQNRQNGNGAAAAKELEPAPMDTPPIAKAAPQSYSVEFLFRTEEGFDVLMRGNELSPRDAMLWARAASKQLAEQGFKPVRRDLVVNVAAAAAAPAAAAGAGAAAGEAQWIKGEGGAPPKCSKHGAGKWVEGTYKEGHQKAGQHFAFWSCTDRNCRPKGSAT